MGGESFMFHVNGNLLVTTTSVHFGEAAPLVFIKPLQRPLNWRLSQLINRHMLSQTKGICEMGCIASLK